MQINLKQHEIVAALKQYISGQGINLAGKDVKITFTAGRKEAGTSADVVIEDAEIPGGEVETVKPTLAVVKNEAVASIARDPIPAAGVTGQAEPAVAAGAAAEGEYTGESDRPLGQLPSDEAPAKTTSLFA